MACWHPGVRFSSSLTICLLSLLALLFPVLSSFPLAVLVGNSVSLPIPFSLPSAQVQIAIIWRRNATILAMGNLRPNFTVEVDTSFQSQFSVDPVHGNLNISDLRTTDSGMYSVEIFPLGSVAQKGNITIRVYEKVGNISVIPPSAEVIEGSSSVAFNCTPVHGSVSWSKDGHRLDDNPHYLRSSGYLKIKDPLRTDAGVYSCTISNPFGNATATANLTVYYGPETPTITVSSSEQDSNAGNFVLVNSTVNLTCLAPSNPPAKIYWNVADNMDLDVPSSPVLPLHRVQLNQGGLYSCLAINQKTKLQIRNTRLINVVQAPWGSPRCSVTSVQNDSALLFVCSWTGGSPAPSLTFQGLPVSKTEIGASKLQSLLVPPFPAGISGTKVTCLGHHITGQANCTLIPEAPSGVILSFQTSSDPKGLVTMQLRCQGTFNPVEIEWVRDKQSLIPAGSRYQLSPDKMHLTIWNFTAPQDLGDYSTICSNPLGSQRSNLTIIGPSISDWTLSSGSHPGTASLTWTVPNGSAVTSFAIQMRGPKQHRSAEEWSTVEVLGAANRSTTVIGLQPQTTYAFQIVPYLGSQAGNGTQIHTLHPDSYLSGGAIAGIVIGCIFGMLLIIALIFLVVWLVCLRRAKEKSPPTPPEIQHHYLSRQFPNGRKVEPSDSWDNPRWSSGDSDIYAITYEEHLHRYLGPTTLPIGIREGTSSSPTGQPGRRIVRNATQV
ncbi:V-set and immunoglobulin domain-containing protein 10-like isoform X1 [Pantherophis guttatus]|uniref:V-set and immunoglobulin domain-containing protein 10-like isoform X1 n=2 Tax=Pantherophis guttatus TaxID=94885 RepID=UPI00295B6B1D|nr:V-set and immunoglobulin domain-containing protein 10-like isoform X1 [Pantherophis guttatus]